MKLIGVSAKKKVATILGDFRTKYILPIVSLIVMASCLVYNFFADIDGNMVSDASCEYAVSDNDDNDQNNDITISDISQKISNMNSIIKEYEVVKRDTIKKRLTNMYVGDDISFSNGSKVFFVDSVANGMYELPITKTTNKIDNDEITINNMDLFSRDEIIKYICEKYNLTEFEFKVIASTVYYETFANNYDDAYRVINTIYNRTKSKRWVNYISSITGLDGESMYAQVIAPSQFDGCISTSGYDYDELLNKVIYDGTKPFENTLDAIFEFLISEKSVHNFLSFKGIYWEVDESEKMKDGYGITDWVKYTDLGNIYHNPLTESDLLDDEYSLVSTQENKNVLTRKRG